MHSIYRSSPKLRPAARSRHGQTSFTDRFELNDFRAIPDPVQDAMGYAPIINKLSTEIAKILTMSDTREKLVAQEQDPFVYLDRVITHELKQSSEVGKKWQ